MTTIDQNEIEKFEKIAQEWWDPNGKFKPLHDFNPIRLKFFKNKICQYYNLQEDLLTPFTNLKILDVGCGGGLVSLPIARLGANLTAIDASEKNINIAKIHASKSGVNNINYLCKTSEDLAKEINDFSQDDNQKFDVIIALEVIEHVANVAEFIESLSKILKPNGILFIATLNRTIKSLLCAKIAVEYILRWLPQGTHDWQKFLLPSEIENYASKNQLKLLEIQGFSLNIIKNEWKLSNNIDINYCMIFKKN